MTTKRGYVNASNEAPTRKHPTLAVKGTITKWPEGSFSVLDERHLLGGFEGGLGSLHHFLPSGAAAPPFASLPVGPSRLCELEASKQYVDAIVWNKRCKLGSKCMVGSMKRNSKLPNILILEHLFTSGSQIIHSLWMCFFWGAYGLQNFRDIQRVLQFQDHPKGLGAESNQIDSNDQKRFGSIFAKLTKNDHFGPSVSKGTILGAKQKLSRTTKNDTLLMEHTFFKFLWEGCGPFIPNASTSWKIWLF